MERRASRVADPIAKLRYLRREGALRRRRAHAVGGAAKILALMCALVLLGPVGRVNAVRSTPRKPVMAPAVMERIAAPVWLVEESGTRRVYSNGLIVRADYAMESVLRRYRTYSRIGLRAGNIQTAPAGIVFHTTESLMVPLVPGLRQALQTSRESVLTHVRRDRLYNFVIDRFGQVYGVVPEEQVAMHAGNSVWADSDRVFVGLNESFLGVSFEAQTGSEFAPTAAQVHAGRLVTEMLRSRYSIAEANCVTHAQVSVNPDNMRLGYHTDWGSNFPFQDLALRPGYAARVAAVRMFGFTYDEAFLAAIGGRAWEGLAAAEEELGTEAAARGLTPVEYRQVLQDQYRKLRRDRNERAK